MKNLVVGLIILVVAIIAAVFLYSNYGGLLQLPKASPRSPKTSPSEISGQTIGLVSVRIVQAAPANYFFGNVATFGWISLVNNGNQSVDVTGWKIQGNVGSFIIPKAVEVYHPSGLSPDSNIVMQPGDRLYIYTNNSPISRNFMVNRCVGYLENEIAFNPPLPLLCPQIDRQDIIQLSGECQNYLISLGVCETPEQNHPTWSDYNCAQKLKDINYRGCYEKYGADDDFLTGEWRIWGGGSFLDSQHDLIRLINKQGLIVDDYIY